MPGIADRHVHLGLVAAAALADTAVVEVHDLGWIPQVARNWKITSPTGGVVKIAGPFLTAVGGYPTNRAWAPPGSARELAGPEDGARAVEEAAQHGHDVIKLVLHSGGPLLDDATLIAVVRTAHQHRLPVGVHAEGEGQARRAFEAGADILVHVPWTESLPDDLIAAMTRSMTWTSTFAIHPDAGREMALANACRFIRAGGRLHYGTDMGNGPTPVGPRSEEIRALAEAGLAGDALREAITTNPGRDGLPISCAVHAASAAERAAETVVWMSQAARGGRNRGRSHRDR
jgi:imidazolonepropionase-like amidohydrolase